MRATLAASGPADADAAWERYLRPAAWSGWSPQIRSVECTDERLRAGSSGVVRTVLGIGIPFRVTAVDDRARTWSWEVRLPLGLSLTLHHGVAPSPVGTTTTLVVEGPAPLVPAYLPLAQIALTHLVHVRERS